MNTACDFCGVENVQSKLKLTDTRLGKKYCCENCIAFLNSVDTKKLDKKMKAYTLFQNAIKIKSNKKGKKK